nr:hypothetical protein [Tanacetum cinerariifolium]
GHSTLSCKFRPRTDDEIATNTVKEAIHVNGFGVTVSSSDLNEGFVFVGKKNKPVITQNISAPVKNDNYNKSNFYGMRGKGVDNRRRQLAGNQKQYGNGQVFNDTGNFWRNIQGNNASNRQISNKNGNVCKKPLYQYRNDPNFKPKFLVRGSVFNNNVNRVSDETINIKNSFNVLSNDGDDTDDMGGINVNDEFESKVTHCFVDPVNGDLGFFCSFVYAFVNTVDRRCLWKSLSIFKGIVKDKPWTIL